MSVDLSIAEMQLLLAFLSGEKIQQTDKNFLEKHRSVYLIRSKLEGSIKLQLNKDKL